MARKNEPTNRYENFDWIAYEQDRREREEYVAGLFHPMYHACGRFKVKWLVEGFLPIGSLCLIAGHPKVGKTSFATALALAVANGVPFAGFDCNQGAVLWIAAEESPEERIQLFEHSRIAESSTPLYTCYQPLYIDEEESLSAIRQWITDTGARLIVVDPLLGAIRGRSLQDSWSARRSIQSLKRFCALNGVSAIVLHHQKRDRHRRSDSVADNAQLAATASMNIVLTTMIAEHSPFLEEAVSLPRIDRACEDSCGGGIEGGGETSDSPSSFSRGTSLERRKGPADGGQSEEEVDSENPESRFPNPARIIRLDCEGRGSHANQTLFLYSKGPLDYRPMSNNRRPKSAEAPLAPSDFVVLRTLYRAHGSVDSEYILQESGIGAGTARNAITNLRRRGLIRISQVQNNIREYEINREGLYALDGQERLRKPWIKDADTSSHDGRMMARYEIECGEDSISLDGSGTANGEGEGAKRKRKKVA